MPRKKNPQSASITLPGGSVIPKAPTRPPSNYQMWKTQRRKELKDDLTFTKAGFRGQEGILSQEWNSMSLAEKDEWTERRKPLLDDFKREKQAWKDKYGHLVNVEGSGDGGGSEGEEEEIVVPKKPKPCPPKNKSEEQRQLRKRALHRVLSEAGSDIDEDQGNDESDDDDFKLDESALADDAETDSLDEEDELDEDDVVMAPPKKRRKIAEYTGKKAAGGKRAAAAAAQRKKKKKDKLLETVNLLGELDSKKSKGSKGARNVSSTTLDRTKQKNVLEVMGVATREMVRPRCALTYLYLAEKDDLLANVHDTTLATVREVLMRRWISLTDEERQKYRQLESDGIAAFEEEKKRATLSASRAGISFAVESM